MTTDGRWLQAHCLATGGLRKPWRTRRCLIKTLASALQDKMWDAAPSRIDRPPCTTRKLANPTHHFSISQTSNRVLNSTIRFCPKKRFRRLNTVMQPQSHDD